MSQIGLDFDRQTFSPEVAEQLKAEGMAVAAESKQDILQIAKEACKQAALGRTDRTATADDAQKFLADNGLPPLGNAAGSLFRSAKWIFTGRYRKSERASNHSHQNRVWMLR